MNPDATGSDKSFLTGSVVVGNHVNIPYPKNEIVPMVAYGLRPPLYHDFAEIGASHVLRRCISLRKACLEQADGGRYVRLQRDYGDLDPPAEQVWENRRGQEILVVNPVDIPELESEISDIKCLLDANTYLGYETKLNEEDIFSRLPIKLRHEIFKHLRLELISALTAASRVMHTTLMPHSIHEIEEKAPRLHLACREQGTVPTVIASMFGDIEVIFQTLTTEYAGLDMTDSLFRDLPQF
ncbi:hypothetical protein BDW60DRAFT_218327 [Aspergillus nidulans var. acristatus]